MITPMRNESPRLLLLLAGLCPIFATACRSAQPRSEADFDDPARQAIELMLDDFHLAASESDAQRYFGHMSEDMIFLRTDATERWTKKQFQAYASDRFNHGQGWTYRPMARHVFLGPGSDVAWFDERVLNEKYGECRGTGALRKVAGVWLLSQYNLTIPVPNDLAPELMRLIRERAVEASARRR
jgi:ketosteroid isomerase-like protein